jgi:L-aspartate oxidase
MNAEPKGNRRPQSSPPPPAPAASRQEEIRDITWRHAGIVRHAEMLQKGLKLLHAIPGSSNLLTVSRILHECALAREESRGAHYREDFPVPSGDTFHSCIQKDRGVTTQHHFLSEDSKINP